MQNAGDETERLNGRLMQPPAETSSESSRWSCSVSASVGMEGKGGACLGVLPQSARLVGERQEAHGSVLRRIQPLQGGQGREETKEMKGLVRLRTQPRQRCRTNRQRVAKTVLAFHPHWMLASMRALNHSMAQHDTAIKHLPQAAQNDGRQSDKAADGRGVVALRALAASAGEEMARSEAKGAGEKTFVAQHYTDLHRATLCQVPPYTNKLACISQAARRRPSRMHRCPP